MGTCTAAPAMARKCLLGPLADVVSGGAAATQAEWRFPMGEPPAIEGRLVKLPTDAQMQQQWWEESAKRKEEERRSKSAKR